MLKIETWDVEEMDKAMDFFLFSGRDFFDITKKLAGFCFVILW